MAKVREIEVEVGWMEEKGKGTRGGSKQGGTRNAPWSRGRVN
jgi:hypothetical protein